jgi:hypothetical protein
MLHRGEVAMRPVRAITTIVFAAVVAVAVTGSYIAYSTHAPRPPSDISGPTSAAFDRQAAVYAAVPRQFVTPGGQDSFGYQGRFPEIFVLDYAVAGTGDTNRKATPDAGTSIPPAVRRAITNALADVAPLTFVASPAAAIDQQHNQVRNEGILVTFGPLVGLGDRVQVRVDGFASGVAATWLTYAVERTGSGWVVGGVTVRGAVA